MAQPTCTDLGALMAPIGELRVTERPDFVVHVTTLAVGTDISAAATAAANSAATGTDISTIALMINPYNKPYNMGHAHATIGAVPREPSLGMSRIVP